MIEEAMRPLPQAPILEQAAMYRSSASNPMDLLDAPSRGLYGMQPPPPPPPSMAMNMAFNSGFGGPQAPPPPPPGNNLFGMAAQGIQNQVQMQSKMNFDNFDMLGEEM